MGRYDVLTRFLSHNTLVIEVFFNFTFKFVTEHRTYDDKVAIEVVTLRTLPSLSMAP